MVINTFCYKTIPSPVGSLQLVCNEKALTAILWENDNLMRVPMQLLEQNQHVILLQAEQQMQEYFAGTRQIFTVPLQFCQGTKFQKTVWQALLTIPFGETRSYAQIAAQIGNSKAVRAVGGANSKNPLSIITPCHRVIGANGTLTGFAGGLDIKAFLLNHEGVHII